jgi:hypothetical protein
MVFEREGCKPILHPTEAQLRRALSLTKSSFASLTAGDRSFLQVGGGPGLFVLEYHDASGRHFRARQATPVTQFEDGTTISFTASTLKMMNREWFLIGQVSEVFAAFSGGAEFPTFVQWQPLSEYFAYAS